MMDDEMELDLERFTGIGRSYQPKVSIRRTGQIGFSVGAIQQFNLKDYSYAVLFYDSTHMVIGIKPTKEPEKDAYSLRVRDVGADVTAKAFLDYFQIPHTETKQYKAMWSDKYQMVLVYLNSND